MSEQLALEINFLTAPDSLNFPEGPAFDRDGRLWCVEVLGGSLVRRDAGGLTRFATGGQPNGLTFDGKGRAWFCDAEQCAIRYFNPDTSHFKTVASTLEGQSLNKPNDLAFDAAGNLLFTCPGNSRQEPTGYVACLRLDGSLHKIADGMYFPNGLALIDEGHSLVVAETYRHRLWKGVWDMNTATWLNPQPWAEVGGPIGPDGMAPSADGLLYVAIFGQGCIKAVDQHGQVRQVYALPGNRPTNVAFDPAGRLGLVVTEAERGVLLSLPQLGTGVPLFNLTILPGAG